jgi:hypothetical protein
MLHRHDGHAEAVARIGWCVEQHTLGVITGEVGAGKTVAVRAATAALDGSRHVVIYLPNPSVAVRGMLHHIVAALGQTPPPASPSPRPTPADPHPPTTPSPLRRRPRQQQAGGAFHTPSSARQTTASSARSKPVNTSLPNMTIRSHR